MEMEAAMDSTRSDPLPLEAVAAVPSAKLVIWTWCPVCGVTTDQEFEREDSVREYYRCTSCGQLHGIAVR